MNEIAQLVSTLGLPVVLILGLCLATWRVCTFLGRRLFDEEKGILTQLVAKHGDFIDSTTGHLNRQEKLAEANSKLLIDLAALQADPKGPTSTVGTNEAIVHLAEALELIAENRGVDISEHVAAIRRTLTRCAA